MNKELSMKNNFCKKGASLLEAVLALAIFGSLAAYISGTIISQEHTIIASAEYIQAQALADEAVAGLQQIRDGAFNQFVYSTSSLSFTNGEWILGEEGSVQTIGSFSRYVSFHDICRDVQDQVTSCPGSYIDPHSILAQVHVEWTRQLGQPAQVKRDLVLTNGLRSTAFLQTDWQAGKGQAIYNDDAAYQEQNGELDDTYQGRLTLAREDVQCGAFSWEFTDPSSYIYNEQEVAVTDGQAVVLPISQVEQSWWNGAYLQRIPLRILTGSVSPYLGYDGYTVRVQGLDTASLITLGSLQADCDDMRIVYDDGQTQTVLDSQIVDCNTLDTSVVFQLQADIAGDTLLTNRYYLYTNNPQATIGPHDLRNIYQWVDQAQVDNTHVYTQGRGDNWHGQQWAQSMAWNPAGYYTYNTGDNTTDSFRIPEGLLMERDAYIEAEFYHTNAYPNDMTTGLLARYVRLSGANDTELSDNYYASSRADSPFFLGGYSTDGDIVKGERTQTVVDGQVLSSIVDNVWRKQALAVWGVHPTRLRYWDAQSRDVFGALGWPSIPSTASGQDPADSEQTGEWGIIAAQDQARFRNLIVRRYIEPEPIVQKEEVQMLQSEYATKPHSIVTREAFRPQTLSFWSGFFEEATTYDGEIYYQLSIDDGNEWLFYDGTAWRAADDDEYNTATQINTHVSTLSTSTGQLSVKALLYPTQEQTVMLDTIEVRCAQSFEWNFNNSNDYQVDQGAVVSNGLAQLTSQNEGVNDFIEPFVDQFIFDEIAGNDSRIFHIANNVYGSVYRGTGNDGFLRTFVIDSDGQISNTIIDTFEFDTVQATYPDIVHVGADLYAIAYRGAGSDGFLATVQIDTNGNIHNSVLDTLEFDQRSAYNIDIFPISNSVIGIAYRGSGSDGFIKTFSIDNTGGISDEIDVLEFDTSTGYYPKVISVGTDIYAITYRGSGNDGFIKTINISSNGIITDSIIDTFEFDTSIANYPSIVQVGVDIYAIAYRGAGSDGFIKTVSIDSNGSIGNTVVDSLEFASQNILWPRIVAIQGETYAIVYEDQSSSDGFVSLITIDDLGNIGSNVSATYEFEAQDFFYGDILLIDQDTLAISYTKYNDGYVTTIDLMGAEPTYANSVPSVTSLVAYESVAISSFQSFVETATKNGGEIYYQLSIDGANSWLYVNNGVWMTSTLATDRSTAQEINATVDQFPTSSLSIHIRAFLESDGTHQVTLDAVQLAWSEQATNQAYAQYGTLQSSAIFLQQPRAITVVEWDQQLQSCTPDCLISLQLRTASNNNGTPGIWTDWTGIYGAGSVFSVATGDRISPTLNGNEWLQYRVILEGDGTDTPILESITIYYQ